jgi:hypothetical protein
MKRKKHNEKPRKTLLIVTASESESLYFSQMRKDCRYTNMTVAWAEGAQSLEELIQYAYKMRTKGKFDSTWSFFGFEDYAVRSDHVAEALQYATKKRVQLAWVQPGLSLWYLLHLQSPRMPISDSTLIASTLKGVFHGFSGDADYLLHEGAALHLRLFSAKAQAVVNAGAYNAMVQQRNASLPPVNMTKLLNEISDICGTADMSHNQKLIGLKNG